MPRTLGQAAAFLVGFAAALWLAPGLVHSARAELAETPAPFAALEAELHHSVNDLRKTEHLLLLSRRPELDRVARAHSRDMARRGYLSHESPEGANPVDRLDKAGVTGFTLAAENAGRTDRPDPNREILVGWITSAEHRRNLYAPPFNTTGIGVARASNGALVYTQLYVTYPR